MNYAAKIISNRPVLVLCAVVSVMIAGPLVSPGESATWDIETVDSVGYMGLYTSLALDSSGNPHISYCDYTNSDLKYTAWDGNTWNIETVDSGGDVGQDTSLALDSSGNPHISYFDWTNRDLKYVHLGVKAF